MVFDPKFIFEALATLVRFAIPLRAVIDGIMPIKIDIRLVSNFLNRWSRMQVFNLALVTYQKAFATKSSLKGFFGP